MSKMTATATISCLVQISHTQLAATASYYFGICSVFAAIDTDADTSVCPLMKGLTSSNTTTVHQNNYATNTSRSPDNEKLQSSLTECPHVG